MTIKKLKEQLLNSEHPIEKILHENSCSTVSVIGFSNGMMLKENRVENPTKLYVLSGSIKYIELHKKITLHQFDELEIPTDVTHYLIAEDNSLCLLAQNKLYQGN